MMEIGYKFFHFCKAWELLSQSGKCDGIGGAEFRRVIVEWIEADMPTPATDFIIKQANAMPI